MIENDDEMAPEQAPRYRVGHHQPQNLYDGDEYIGVMFSALHAARVVAALNNAPVHAEDLPCSRHSKTAFVLSLLLLAILALLAVWIWA